GAVGVAEALVVVEDDDQVGGGLQHPREDRRRQRSGNFGGDVDEDAFVVEHGTVCVVHGPGRVPHPHDRPVAPSEPGFEVAGDPLFLHFPAPLQATLRVGVGENGGGVAGGVLLGARLSGEVGGRLVGGEGPAVSGRPIEGDGATLEQVVQLSAGR